MAPGGEAGQGRHQLGLRQLLVFTGRRVEELLRVLDRPSHGLDEQERGENDNKCETFANNRFSVLIDNYDDNDNFNAIPIINDKNIEIKVE